MTTISLSDIVKESIVTRQLPILKLPSHRSVKEYSFTLKFNFPDARIDPDCYIEQLYEAGCDDALIGIGKQGCIALEFIRSASSAFDAISSAIVNVKKVIPDAILIEATPD